MEHIWNKMLHLFCFISIIQILFSQQYLGKDMSAQHIPPLENWLVVSNMFYFPFQIWEFHNPNWQTPSFFRRVGIPQTRKDRFGKSYGFSISVLDGKLKTSPDCSFYPSGIRWGSGRHGALSRSGHGSKLLLQNE